MFLPRHIFLFLLGKYVGIGAGLHNKYNIYKCLGEGNGNPVQCSCLENSMDREAWWAIVHGITKSQTRLSD